MNNLTMPIIKIIDLLGGSDTAFGNTEGRAVFQKLTDAVDQFPAHKIIGISLAGMRRTDASFPRESVVSFAKAKRGEKGFYLVDIPTEDFFDNWDYAAKAKSQNLIVIEDDGFRVVGPELNVGANKLLDFVYQHKCVSTARLASDWGISPPNASAKLKKLLDQGLILGQKESAASGGQEYIYRAIKPD